MCNLYIDVYIHTYSSQHCMFYLLWLIFVRRAVDNGIAPLVAKTIYLLPLHTICIDLTFLCSKSPYKMHVLKPYAVAIILWKLNSRFHCCKRLERTVLINFAYVVIQIFFRYRIAVFETYRNIHISLSCASAISYIIMIKHCSVKAKQYPTKCN